jgi:hypothetical protein
VLPTAPADATATAMPYEQPARAAHGVLEIGATFGPRYRVLKLLGMGGMGAVYQAWDEELAMAVALKVIRRDPSAGASTGESERRLKQELVLARQVTHKLALVHIGLGDADRVRRSRAGHRRCRSRPQLRGRGSAVRAGPLGSTLRPPDRSARARMTR